VRMCVRESVCMSVCVFIGEGECCVCVQECGYLHTRV